MKSPSASQGQSASELISNRIAELGDWRGETLARMRRLIREADPDVVEEWKWMGTPVWEHDGIICTGETYKTVVKLTFAKGAALDDPARLFNSSLDGAVRRAIDIPEGVQVDEAAFKALVLQAMALNSSSKKKPAKKAKSWRRRPVTTTIYGIKACDTMKKARDWLDQRGVAYRFHDYKVAGVSKAALEGWVRQVGWEVLLNRAGTTFRKLPDADRADLTEAKAIALMLVQPSMIKRPVLDTDGQLTVGFKPDVYAARFA